MTRLLVAEDEAMLRTALVAVFEAAGFTVTAVGRGDEVATTVAEFRPAVAVLDIHLPGRDGISLATDLATDPATDPATGGVPPRIVLLTAVGRPGPVARALAAPIGALLLKSATATELVDAVRTVLAGGRLVDPELVALAARARPGLSRRELDVLGAAADGAPVDEVAGRLFLAPTTVRNHLTAILAKTGARNRFEAVQQARDMGWLEPPTT